MSIDSTYAQQRIPASTGLSYPLELESVGASTFKVYRVKDGVLTLLPDGDYVMQLTFEEHLDPIKKRGTITLNKVLPADEEILIVRETPIEQEFDGVIGLPFETKQWEYVLDKSMLILQELEGNICDCREPDWDDPDPPPIEPPGLDPDEYPECEPYACSAIRDETPGLVDHYWPMEIADAYYEGTPVNYHYRHTASKGTDMQFGGSFPIDNNFSNDPVLVDGCYESWQRIGESSGSGAGQHLPDTTLVSSYANTANVCARLRTYPANNKYLRCGAGFWTTSPTYFGDLLFVDVQNQGDTILNVQSGGFDGAEYNENFTWASLGVDPKVGHMITVIVSSVTYPDGGESNYPRIVVTFSVYLNGSILVTSFTKTKSQSNLSGVAPGTCTYFPTGASYFVNNCSYADRAMSGQDLNYLALYYDRNQAGYTPPEYCNT